MNKKRICLILLIIGIYHEYKYLINHEKLNRKQFRKKMNVLY